MMKRHTSRHSVLAALLVVAVILVAGGAAIASNAGFKFNMPITTVTGVGGLQGHNWVSLPFFSPYGSRDDLCTACGLSDFTASITTISTAGAVNQQQCSVAPAALIAGEGVRIIAPSGDPTNCIVVGSHDPSLSILLPGPAPSAGAGKYWLSVPYHATATTRNELCTQIGLSDATSFLLSIDPATGSVNQQQCGFAPGAIILGQSLQVSAANGPLSFTPAHF
jgi:hypothetical protein